MLNKAFLLMSVCLLNVSIAYRLPRDTGVVKTTEFTDDQLKILQTELEKKLPKELADQITNTLSKFTTDSVHTYTPDEKYKAFLELTMLTLRDNFSGALKYDIEKVLQDAFTITIPGSTAEKFSLLQNLQTPLEKEMPKQKLDKLFSTTAKMASPDIRIVEQGLIEFFTLIEAELGESEFTTLMLAQLNKPKAQTQTNRID